MCITYWESANIALGNVALDIGTKGGMGSILNSSTTSSKLIDMHEVIELRKLRDSVSNPSCSACSVTTYH